MIPSEGVSVLGQYEWRHKKSCETEFHMPRVSSDVSSRESVTI